MTVLITLTTAGTDTGPFDLYSNVDGYVSAFETGVSKAALQAGYSSALVPNGTTTIRIKSTGTCVNYIDVTVVTTTTTTTTGTPTTTTTTSVPPTTTTTTTSLYYYYVVKKFDCASSCAYVSPDLVARSSTPLSTIDGVYYKPLGSFTYQIQSEITPAPGSFDISLDGAPSNANCVAACAL
jgi:hypothetical protein